MADPEGMLTAFYGDSSGLRLRMRSPAGVWGSERRIDGPAGMVASGVMATEGTGGRIHVAYTAGSADRRDVWYRTLSPSGELGEAVRVAPGVGVSDEAGYVTGQTLHVNGGMVMI